MRTRKLHPELKSLLQNLAGDTEIPDEESQASEASRQKVDQILKKINQEQSESVPESKPVYSKPPKHKKILKSPVPVEHFSEEPSQNPAVRMHDRLLQDAMPKPDPERRPRNSVKPDSHKNSSKNLNKKSGKNSGKTGEHPEQKTTEKKIKKSFHIQIGELPPDIPRDTSVADRIREERLAQTLAAVPPKTPEQLRKEQVRKRAMKIREQIRLQEELARQAVLSREIPSPEPEEDIPAWEDKLAELSEKNSENSADQLRIFSDSVTEILMTPKAQDAGEAPPDLQFDQTVVLQTVSMRKLAETPEVLEAQESQESRKFKKLRKKKTKIQKAKKTRNL
ncbi:MAG: hypothetical protein K2H82_08720 [Oscillospiraceae bacterium]|nr:hypothetical protein [Oscillospiraceae bacterium]